MYKQISFIQAVEGMSGCGSRDRKFKPQLSHVQFLEIDHEIITVVMLPLLVIQEGKLSVTGKNTCTKYWLTV